MQPQIIHDGDKLIGEIIELLIIKQLLLPTMYEKLVWNVEIFSSQKQNKNYFKNLI